jgi:mannitol-1-phosphate 5-dehydrogenase
VVFCDVMDSVIDQLNKSKSYKVIQAGAEGNSESVITNYRAINSKTHEADVIKEITTADVVTCSVGPNILKFIAPVIAKGVDARPNDATPIAVIACSNAIGATDTLAEKIMHPNHTPEHRLDDHHERARYANSAIDRIVPVEDLNAGLDVKLEKFYEWVVDKSPFVDHEPPAIKGIKWVDDPIPYIERKLFTVNTGHAAAAYHGYYHKKTADYVVMQEKIIMDKVRKPLAETSALVGKYGIEEQGQRDYVEKIITRIGNPHLEDAVERVGCAPLRKLSRKERLIGPAAELAEEGKPFDALLDAAEMAFWFQNVEGDGESDEMAKIMKDNKAEAVVEKVCGLTSSDKLYVVETVKKVQAIAHRGVILKCFMANWIGP